MNTVQDRNEFSISVVELVTLLKRHIAMILGGVATFLACTLFISPVYMAGAKMIVNSRSVQADTVTNDQITSSRKLVDTDTIIYGYGRRECK